MKIVDRRNDELKHIMPHIVIYPFLSPDATGYDMAAAGNISVVKVHDEPEAKIIFNVHLETMTLERLIIFRRAIQQAEYFCDIELLTHPDKPLIHTEFINLIEVPRSTLITFSPDSYTITEVDEESPDAATE